MAQGKALHKDLVAAFTAFVDADNALRKAFAEHKRGMAERAARQVYDETSLGPDDVQVIELHDCFSANELITYEGLGLAEEGRAGDLIMDGAVTYGGKWVVNPSGGLISKGHPLGATGLAQCAELTWQLRGTADARQVPDAKVAIQHNLGLGGAAVVTVYARPARAEVAA